MDGSPALAQPPSQPQPETVVSPAAKTLPNTSISPTTLAKATLASPTLKDWFKWSPGEQNLENLAQLAFPEVFDLAWGLDLIPAEEEDGDVKEDHCHDEEGGTSPSKDFIIRSPLSTLAFLNDSSSLNVTPPYDTFASPSPERSPYYYYNGNDDSKDDSEDGGPFAISSGSDQDDEYAEIGIDLTKYWATTVDGKEASHTPSKRPRGRKQQIQSLLISSPTKKSKYASATTTTTTTTTTAKSTSKKKSKKAALNGNGDKEPTEGAKYEAERRRKRKEVLASLKPFLNVKVRSFLFPLFVCWPIKFCFCFFCFFCFFLFCRRRKK
jgi:hypothetical protein